MAKIDGRKLAKARDRWFASHDGKISLDGSCEGQYLKNRLERAFIAGFDAAMKLMERKKLPGFEDITGLYADEKDNKK